MLRNRRESLAGRPAEVERRKGKPAGQGHNKSGGDRRNPAFPGLRGHSLKRLGREFDCGSAVRGSVVEAIELGPVGTGSDDDADAAGRALSLVVALQTAAEARYLDAHQRIPLLAEVQVLAVDVRGDREFLDFLDFSVKGLLAEILEELGEGGGA